MKKIFLLTTLLALASCAKNYENYYLKSYPLTENIQEKSTTEVVFNNLIYAKLLTKGEAVEQFGLKAKKYSVIFVQFENKNDDTSYFSFDKSILENNDDESVNAFKLGQIIKPKKLNLNKAEDYTNPFSQANLDESNFIYNVQNKVLNDFALKPNQNASGFLVFKKLDDATKVRISISSGLSMHTARVQEIKLDD